MRIRVWIAALGLGWTSVTFGAAAQSGIDPLIDDFIYGSLALQPATATANGFHRYRGRALDAELDDLSAAGVAKLVRFNHDILRRVAALDTSRLDAEQRADLAILSNGAGLTLFDYEHRQIHRHNPTTYVELVGNALYTPYVLEYAARPVRYRQIIARLKQVPELVKQGEANLVDSPAVWNRVAQEENDGNIELIDTTLRAAVPAELKGDYQAAATAAIAALRGFNDWLKNSLSQHVSDWRLGKDDYRQRCAYVLATDLGPDQLLAAAEADLQKMRAELARLAAPRTPEEALADVASHHPSRAGYMDAARRDLATATAFVKAKNLLTLPTGGTLSVIETPVFMRGSYGVGGFNPAPALEPRLGAFYWVTPIPADWPQARVDSKLREYNDFGMQHLTVHEAMPGHWVQAEVANEIQPLRRRLLRNIWGNGPYVEGWAVYTQQMMTDQGYLNGDVAMRITLLKQLLRATANTILDIRLQTLGMTDQQALDLMIDETYQEREEATAKLQRAQLGSCQLDYYYSGWKGWLEVREHYQARHPGDYSLHDFNDRALREGAVPLPTLDELLK
ncbi:MAG TPA: DUF885 domain-containing protein [Steroidobacteraceae bacterium]|nr:DUF885 domain-containing protein [Steroidobacteraceae bacterium]